MPSMSTQLRIGIFDDLYHSLSHVTIRPKDPELEILTARFFLSLNDKPPLDKEVFQIGRDQYNNADDLNKDAKLAIKNVRSYLKETRDLNEHSEQSRQLVNTLINNLKMGTTGNRNPATNSTESLTSWELFTDQMLGRNVPTVEDTLRELKQNLDDHAQLMLSKRIITQRMELEAEAKKQKEEKQKKAELRAEEKKAEMKKIIPGGNVRALIDQFNPKPPTPITRIQPLKRAKPQDDKKGEQKAKKSDDDDAASRRRQADTDNTQVRVTPPPPPPVIPAQPEPAPEPKPSASKASGIPTMKQQAMSPTVVAIPAIKFNNAQQIDEVLSVAKTLADKKQLKQANELFSHFHQQAILTSDPVTRSLELRKALLEDWNNNLLPFQSELLDRISQLQVLDKALVEAQNFINTSNNPALSQSDKEEYLAALDKRIITTRNALDSYENTLEEFNNMEVGLANTNITIYHDPDFEGQTNVAASVVRKIAAGEDQQALLNTIRHDLGIKVSERSNKGALAISTQAFELERDKIDTTRHYTLLGFIGTDTKSVNSAHDKIATVRLQSNLNTVYSMSAAANDRNSFTLEVIDLRDDLDPTHLMAKFASSVNSKLGDLHALFGNASPEDLYKLFSQLPKQIPDIKTLENFLAQHMQATQGVSPAKVAKAMHKELMRTLRNEKYPDVPCIEALRLAKDTVNKLIDSTDSKHTINILGKNAEMRRAMKYYCEMMIQQFKGHPDEQKKYDYFDGQDKFRPVLKSGILGSVSSLFSYKDPAEKTLLKDLSLNKSGRRVSKELLRDESELDDQVHAKTSFAEQLELQKSKSKDLTKLSNALRDTNSKVNASAFLQDAFEAAKSNARSAYRLPQATTELPARHP